MVDITQLAQFGVNGLVVGAILTLTAVGLTLTYGILNFPNFSHGDLVTMGAYFGLFFTALAGLPATTGWATGLVVLLVGAVVIDRLVRPRLGNMLPEGSHWTRSSLSRDEATMALFVAVIVLTIMAGLRFPIPVGTATGVAAAVAIGTVLTLVGAAPAVRAGEDGARGRVAGGVLAGVIVAAALGWLPSVMGTRGFGTWAVTVGLLAVVAAAVTSTREPLRNPWVLAGLGIGSLLTAYIAASPLILGIVIALAVAAAVTSVLDLLVWRRMRSQRAGIVTLIIVSIGLALLIRNLVIMEWGTSTRPYPETLRRSVSILGSDVVITPNQAIALVVTVIVILLVHFFLRYTRTGKAMRALSDNPELARVSGIDVDRVILYVWGIAGVLAALSGILLGLIRPIHPNLGWFLLLPIFASVILGGIGSPYGAMAGGFIIGIAMEASPGFGISSEYKLVVGFAILILVLLVRPKGIFAGQATR